MQEFNLIEKRELAPLQELIDKLAGGRMPGAAITTTTIPEEAQARVGAGGGSGSASSNRDSVVTTSGASIGGGMTGAASGARPPAPLPPEVFHGHSYQAANAFLANQYHN